jgi:hypothetical protein
VVPLRVKKTRQNGKLEPGFDFIKAEVALAAFTPRRKKPTHLP